MQQTVQSYTVNISGTVIHSDAPWTYFLGLLCLYFICIIITSVLFLLLFCFFQRVSRGKKEGSAINQNIHGNTFSGEKRVKPTDRPPPKKLPSPSGMKTIYASWLFNPMLQCTNNLFNHRCGFGVRGLWELEMKDPSEKIPIWTIPKWTPRDGSCCSSVILNRPLDMIKETKRTRCDL